MERDLRRDRGLWHGYHNLNNTVCDSEKDDNVKRQRGLKMGHKYFHYYEVDCTESLDPLDPATNSCPYLPGPTINVVNVPIEQSTRTRRGSSNSARPEDFRTMDPDHKFLQARPAPSPPPQMVPEPEIRRLGSAPVVHSKRSCGSLSSAVGWNRLFGRKTSSSSLRESHSPKIVLDERSETISESCHSRDVLPRSLRNFLTDDSSCNKSREVMLEDRSAIVIIPEGNEESEDDENFAIPVEQETAAFTILSPPPSQQSLLSLQTVVNPRDMEPCLTPRPISKPQFPRLQSIEDKQPQSHFSIDSSVFNSASPKSPNARYLPQFSHSDDDEEEEHDESFPSRAENNVLAYSLPCQDAEKLSVEAHRAAALRTLDSTAFVAHGTDMPIENSALVPHQVPDSGLDDMVNDLGWMLQVIHGKSF